jgi:hypothetical protein
MIAHRFFALAIHAACAAAADEMEFQFGDRAITRVGVSSGIAVMAPVEGEGRRSYRRR